MVSVRTGGWAVTPGAGRWVVRATTLRPGRCRPASVDGSRSRSDGKPAGRESKATAIFGSGTLCTAPPYECRPEKAKVYHYPIFPTIDSDRGLSLPCFPNLVTLGG